MTDLQPAIESTGLDVLMLVEYGSRAHGTADENSDRDLLGVYVERDREVYGLETAQTRKYRLHPNGGVQYLGANSKHERSGSDVVEMEFHPLRKYVKLAAAGNPTVLSAMWSPEHLDVVHTDAGELLAAHRDAFLSKHAAFRHAGYARSQRGGLLGTSNKRTNRPELIAQFGHDVKYSSHLIRVLYAGLDLVRDRTIHLPMKPEQLELLREIRRGEVPLDDVVTLSEKLEHELETEAADSDLPEEADWSLVNDLLRDVRNLHLGR